MLLPAEVIQRIVPYCDVVSALNLACASKFLYHTISDIDLVKCYARNTSLQSRFLARVPRKHVLLFVRTVVEKGCRVPWKPGHPLECCFWACRVGDVDVNVVEYLVSLGADITKRDNYCIRWASENNNLDMVRTLVNLGADVQEGGLYVACVNGFLPMIKLLVELGADINQSGCCFRAASKGGHLEVVSYLAPHFAADENRVGIYNDALVVASIYANKPGSSGGKHFDIVRYLIKQGASVQAGNNSAFREACKAGDLELAYFLAEEGCKQSQKPVVAA